MYRSIYVDLYAITQDAVCQRHTGHRRILMNEFVIKSVWSIVYHFFPLYHVTHVATICKPDGYD